MELGPFSVSLTVEDLDASRDFYEKLDFEVIDGRSEDGWLIMEHRDVRIGLFHGTFDGNILTFNPSDVRAVQRTLKDRGVGLLREADEDSGGPTSAMLLDPDGNLILLDQS